MNGYCPGMGPLSVPKRTRGHALLEVIAVLAVLSVFVGYGVYGWNERKDRAQLASDLTTVRSLAGQLDRKYCTRTSARQMTLNAATGDLGSAATVKDADRWWIHLNQPTGPGPAPEAVDQYFLHRSPTLVVYRVSRNSPEGAHLLGEAGAVAVPVTTSGGTVDSIQIPVVREEQIGGSRREFRFLMRDSASLTGRC